MSESNSYYTLKGYSMIEGTQITTAMEDYLEMLCRLNNDNQYLRINTIAGHLHVKPSSASKMIQNLKMHGLVNFEKYGIVSLTEKGRELGKYLLFRHDILNQFFCYINHTDNELEQVEKVEHFIDKRTILHMAEFLEIVKIREH